MAKLAPDPLYGKVRASSCPRPRLGKVPPLLAVQDKSEQSGQHSAHVVRDAIVRKGTSPYVVSGAGGASTAGTRATGEPASGCGGTSTAAPRAGGEAGTPPRLQEPVVQALLVPGPEGNPREAASPRPVVSGAGGASTAGTGTTGLSGGGGINTAATATHKTDSASGCVWGGGASTAAPSTESVTGFAGTALQGPVDGGGASTAAVAAGLGYAGFSGGGASSAAAGPAKPLAMAPKMTTSNDDFDTLLEDNLKDCYEAGVITLAQYTKLVCDHRETTKTIKQEMQRSNSSH